MNMCLIWRSSKSSIDSVNDCQTFGVSLLKSTSTNFLLAKFLMNGKQETFSLWQHFKKLKMGSSSNIMWASELLMISLSLNSWNFWRPWSMNFEILFLSLPSAGRWSFISSFEYSNKKLSSPSTIFDEVLRNSVTLLQISPFGLLPPTLVLNSSVIKLT